MNESTTRTITDQVLVGSVLKSGNGGLGLIKRHPKVRTETEEYSTDKFSKHILLCLFIHETDSYTFKSCQVFFVVTQLYS